MPRYRHIKRLANRQLRGWFPQKVRRFEPSRATQGLIPTQPVIPAARKRSPPMIAALHQGNYATIPNYLYRELRYMDAGELG
jgi:hypothetical protein